MTQTEGNTDVEDVIWVEEIPQRRKRRKSNALSVMAAANLVQWEEYNGGPANSTTQLNQIWRCLQFFFGRNGKPKSKIQLVNLEKILTAFSLWLRLWQK